MKLPAWFEEKRREILQLATATPVTADCVLESESVDRFSEVHVSGAGYQRLNNLMLEVLQGADIEPDGAESHSWLPVVIKHAREHRSIHVVIDDEAARKASG